MRRRSLWKAYGLGIGAAERLEADAGSREGPPQASEPWRGSAEAEAKAEWRKARREAGQRPASRNPHKKFPLTDFNVSIYNNILFKFGGFIHL